MRRDVTRAVAERAHQIAAGALSDDARAIARQCMLDWFGVALAGSSEPVAGLLREQALEEGGLPIATVVGSAVKVSPRQAALLNGATGHALDYDDVNVDAHGHVTAAVLPAALAASEMASASGEQLVRAFVAGYEATVMIGRYVGRSHYERGFHATATIGAFGAAVASAVLLGLDVEATTRAMGIAGTQAGGLKSQFGTMCKPLNAGKASENGIVAALLARRGLTSRTDILECAQGFAETQSANAEAVRALAAPGRGEHILENLFKFSAACYGTHAAIIATERLVREHGLRPDDVRAVEVAVEPGADRICNIHSPRSGLESKFSLRFNVALALAGMNTASPAIYTDANAARSDLCSLRDRVTIRFMPAGWPMLLAEVRVQTTSGQLLTSIHDAGIPCAGIEGQYDRILSKFMALAALRIGERKALALREAIDSVEALVDLDPLMSHTRFQADTDR